MIIYKTNGGIKYDLPNCNTYEECVKEILKNHKKDFRNADFSDSDFRNANFFNSDFRNSDFRNANFRNSNFSGSDFRNSDFINSNFSDSDFSNSNFSNSDFSNSDFRYSDLIILRKRIYKYSSYSFKIGDVFYISMGCKNMKLSEWVNNFWNNDREFPNDGSEKSNKRLYAFNVMRRLIRKKLFKEGNLNPEILELLNREITK